MPKTVRYDSSIVATRVRVPSSPPRVLVASPLPLAPQQGQQGGCLSQRRARAGLVSWRADSDNQSPQNSKYRHQITAKDKCATKGLCSKSTQVEFLGYAQLNRQSGNQGPWARLQAVFRNSTGCKIQQNPAHSATTAVTCHTVRMHGISQQRLRVPPAGKQYNLHRSHPSHPVLTC